MGGGESSAESALLHVNTLLAQVGAVAGTEVPRADPPHTLSRLKSPSLLLFESNQEIIYWNNVKQTDEML